MFLSLLLVLQPGLRAGEASLWFGAALGALALYTSATSDPLSIIYLPVSQCQRIYVCVCAGVCLSALELPCWLRSALFSRLHVSRYRKFPQGVGTQAHTYARAHTNTHAQSQGHTHALTRVHCPLALALVLSVFGRPLADFVFADNRWAAIDSLLSNKYTLRLSLCL